MTYRWLFLTLAFRTHAGIEEDESPSVTALPPAHGGFNAAIFAAAAAGAASPGMATGIPGSTALGGTDMMLLGAGGTGPLPAAEGSTAVV